MDYLMNKRCVGWILSVSRDESRPVEFRPILTRCHQGDDDIISCLSQRKSDPYPMVVLQSPGQALW